MLSACCLDSSLEVETFVRFLRSYISLWYKEEYLVCNYLPVKVLQKQRFLGLV